MFGGIQYNTINSTIKDIKIEISREQHLILAPKSKIVIDDDGETEVEVGYITATIVDDEILHQLEFDMSREKISEIVKVFQILNKQLSKPTQDKKNECK